MITAPNLPPLIASRYVPVRLIAKGGMGAVYEVEHARTGERLALKVLLSHVATSGEELERFKREARAPARIKSEHVVRVTDADVAPELDGAPFLVMELLEGADLEREADANPPAPATVVVWLRQVARALDKAHALGIVHRDLKPKNLFLSRAEDRAPVVKILDFGILKMAEGNTGPTASGQIVGTPKYMAPEQASATAPVTPAADRYALGLVAYRLLVGESYYQGGMMIILGELLYGELQPPSARGAPFGAAFDAWFLKACARDPEQRFPSAAQQIEELSAALGLRDGASPDVATPVAKKRAPRPRRRIAAAVFVSAGLAASVVAIVLHRRPVTRPANAPLPPPVAQDSAAPQLARPAPPQAPGAPAWSPADVIARGPKKAQAPRRPPSAATSVGGEHPGAAPATAPGKEQPKAPDPYADQE